MIEAQLCHSEADSHERQQRVGFAHLRSPTNPTR